MDRTTGHRFAFAFAFALMWTSTAVAEDDPLESGPGESKAASANYPLAYAARPLTMPRGMVRVTFDINALRLGVGGFGSQAVVSLNWGVAVSPVDNLELGFSRYRTGSFPGINSIDFLGLGASGLITAVVSPQGDFGDIPFYARYQVASGVADFALEFRVRFPTLSEWGLAWGLPLRIHAGDPVAIDTGVDLALDDPGNQNIFGVGIPFDITANLNENVFLKVQTGATLPDITASPTITVVPLGFGLGGSVAPGPVILDFFANFRFPVFAAFGQGQSEVTTGVWNLIFALNIYTPVLF